LNQLRSTPLTSLEQSATIEAGGDVGPGGTVTWVVELVLVVDGVVVVGGNVVVEGGGGRWNDCELGVDEHAAATAARGTSAPSRDLRRARVSLTRRRLS
jgi:hypothetical protein